MSLSLKPVLIVAFGEEENLGVGYLLAVLAEAGIPGRMIDIRYEREEILAAIRREGCGSPHALRQYCTCHKF